MTDKKLRPKYMVYKIQSGDPSIPPIRMGEAMKATDPANIDSPFVLMPRKDPAAFRALICYANFCEPSLRAEITEWLDKIAAAEPVLGTQGARNTKEIKAEEIRLGL